MPRQDKRQQIMQAAAKLFSSRRFHEITTDDVAREAKVGKGTIYRYFQDKDELFFETANSGFDELCNLLERKVQDSARFTEQLHEACVQISSFFDRRRRLFQMMQSEDGRMASFKGRLREKRMEKRKKLVDALAGILHRGVQEGHVRSDILPEVLARFLLSMLRTRARELQDAPEQMHGCEVVVDLFCHGMAAGNSLDLLSLEKPGAESDEGLGQQGQSPSSGRSVL